MLRRIVRCALALAVASTLAGVAVAAPRNLSIMAPAAPGGGFDQTARAIQAVLQKEKIVATVKVTNVPGGGGTIGLA